jgi:Spy/CpxP family protein refolding chaperone
LRPLEDWLGGRRHPVSTSYTNEQEDDMRRFWITVMTAAVVATAGGEAIAHGGSRSGAPPQRIAAALDLTDQQKAAWEAAFSTMRATAQPLHAQAKGIRAEIDALFSQGSPDPAVLGQKVIALHAVKEQLREARATMKSATTSVLTEEQKLKLEALEAARPRPGRPWGGAPAPGR